MKRLTLILGILGLAALMTGCADATLRLGRAPAPAAIDQGVVESLVCRGLVAEAERYVELRGGDQAARVERVERARQKTKDEPECCPFPGCERRPASPAGGSK